MFERFTEPARQVVVLAQDEARALKHNYMGTEHILLGLLREEKGLAAQVLDSLDITIVEVRAQVARIIGEGDTVPTGQIPLTPRGKKVFELALREALSLDHEHVGTEHILLGLVREGQGVAARILEDFGREMETVLSETLRMLGATGPRPPGDVPQTERTQAVLRLAEDEARSLGHDLLGDEHILLGMLREGEGLAARVLDTLDVTLEEVRAQVARIAGRGDGVTTGEIPFTPRAAQILVLARREALSLGHNFIGTEHLLLGLAQHNEGLAVRILLDFDADAEKIRNETIRMLSGPGRRTFTAGAAPVPRGSARRRPPALTIPCQACGRLLEESQLHRGDDGTFTAERSGAARCPHCDARFELSYRIEWKRA
jgi:ATP-dependent Clp protease ATP-binding subunit ClpA